MIICWNFQKFFYANRLLDLLIAAEVLSLDKLTLVLLFFNRHEGELCPREITTTRHKRELTIRDSREEKRSEGENIRWCLMVLFEIIMDSVRENKGLFLALKDGKRSSDKCVDAVIRSKSSPIIVRLWTSAFTVLFLSLSSEKNRRIKERDEMSSVRNLDKWPSFSFILRCSQRFHVLSVFSITAQCACERICLDFLSTEFHRFLPLFSASLRPSSSPRVSFRLFFHSSSFSLFIFCLLQTVVTKIRPVSNFGHANIR